VATTDVGRVTAELTGGNIGCGNDGLREQVYDEGDFTTNGGHVGGNNIAYKAEGNREWESKRTHIEINEKDKQESAPVEFSLHRSGLICGLIPGKFRKTASRRSLGNPESFRRF